MKKKLNKTKETPSKHRRKELLICSYSDYDRTGYDIEVMYENCVDILSNSFYKEDEEIMTKEEFVNFMKIQLNFYEWDLYMWDCIWKELFIMLVMKLIKFLE